VISLSYIVVRNAMDRQTNVDELRYYSLMHKEHPTTIVVALMAVKTTTSASAANKQEMA
jgi:hypothetical protein